MEEENQMVNIAELQSVIDLTDMIKQHKVEMTQLMQEIKTQRQQVLDYDKMQDRMFRVIENITK